MLIILINFIILGLVSSIDGKITLQINKKHADMIYPVSKFVEENVGSTFSLVCELVTPAIDNNLFDDQLVWIKKDEDLNKPRTSDIKEINKSERIFNSLETEDSGEYICVSAKFKLKKAVEIIVRDDARRREPKPLWETSYCNEHMFQCLSNGLCIIQRYVCDGQPDCKDGSDESTEQCNGDPCKDKLPCEGRCIPTSWCCDRHHDPNCNVTNRPKCCQGLSESYEEMEFGFPNVSQTQHTARYLFILVCVVSILFSVILLLLIISRVVIFAKKTAIQQNRHDLCENIALRNQTNINVIPCDIYTYRNSRTPRNNIVRNIIIDSSDVNDPLLFNPARFNVINANSLYDQPPSYVDVLRNNRLVAEPPPPYRSQEALNSSINEERNTRD